MGKEEKGTSIGSTPSFSNLNLPCWYKHSKRKGIFVHTLVKFKMNFLQQRNHENMASSVSSHNYSRRETPGHILVEKPINVFSGNMICGSQERWIKHYSSEHSILLVGDGDFSFSLCLGMAFASATNIIATSLDSYGIFTIHLIF